MSKPIHGYESNYFFWGGLACEHLGLPASGLMIAVLERLKGKVLGTGGQNREPTIAELKERIHTLEAENAALQSRVSELEANNLELSAQLQGSTRRLWLLAALVLVVAVPVTAVTIWLVQDWRPVIVNSIVQLFLTLLSVPVVIKILGWGLGQALLKGPFRIVMKLLYRHLTGRTYIDRVGSKSARQAGT